jgi:hypothetical protein
MYIHHYSGQIPVAVIKEESPILRRGVDGCLKKWVLELISKNFFILYK